MLAYMLLGQTRKSVTNIARVCFFIKRHVSSFERFLSDYQWDLTALQQQMLRLIKAQIGDRLLICGAFLVWVDTTLISKVKGRMDGVQTWHDHSGNPDRGERMVGHHWALAGLFGLTALSGVLCFPLSARLISGQLNPLGFVVNAVGEAVQMGFWDAVCPLLIQLKSWFGSVTPVMMRVVADAYFAKAPFINWMLDDGIQVISRMRSDAVGWDDPVTMASRPVKKKRGRPRKSPETGKKWKLAGLLITFPLELIEVTLYGELKKLRLVWRDVWITGVTRQKVRIVVVKQKGQPFILMSTDLSLTATQIIYLYGLRFPLELGIRDTKQNFGLGDYQCFIPLAIYRFVNLALLACSFWRLAIMDEKASEWLENKPNSTPFSYIQASRALRRFVTKSIFHKFALNQNLQNSQTFPEDILKMIV